MSDQPLFQNTDEQEAAYAPQELAAGDPEARRPTDELGTRDAGAPAAEVAVPAAAGLAGGAPSSPATGGLPVASGAPGAAATMADEADAGDRAAPTGEGS